MSSREPIARHGHHRQPTKGPYNRKNPDALGSALSLHFARPAPQGGLTGQAACGRVLDVAHLTEDPLEVTCKWCEKSPAFLDARLPYVVADPPSRFRRAPPPDGYKIAKEGRGVRVLRRLEGGSFERVGRYDTEREAFAAAAKDAKARAAGVRPMTEQRAEECRAAAADAAQAETFRRGGVK
jgi:hypothetical protein